MNCLKNISRIAYPAELVTKLSRLYTFKGKDFYYEDVLKNYMPGIIKETIEKDSIYAAKILNLSISENRIKLILRKNSEPKTKDEKVLENLKTVFTIIQNKGTELELSQTEFLSLATRLFKGHTDIGYASTYTIEKVNLFEEKKKISRRETMEEAIKLYSKVLYQQKIEPTQTITNLFVDLLNLKCFTSNNEFLALIIMYCLLFNNRFNVFKYESFFERYYNKMDGFTTAIAASSFNWDEGYSQTAMLNDALIQLMLDSYERVEKLVDDYKFDKKLKKVDNVESAILKLPTVFTRDNIKNVCPHLSDSTINRALTNLKNEGKIKPNGTGRSATWVKLVPEEIFVTGSRQTSIFDYINTTDEE